MSLIKEINEQVNDSQEIERIINHYRKYRDKMNEKQLRDAIGNDLEMLEYSPEKVEKYVSQALARLKK